ncbi:E3 ubiquitin-protein ligase UPL5 isoform X2 [Oryza brachyantha]|uniref:E3 ubiquitin-protein ligase UPL5 isoform X2 n=1 Tax=Oryza brachyantha TaxID=4533 RepID=UPI001ADC34E3|nr:E3 ubiquitin-protein ligase UPL5 isoform X2 [Oryza brachyantha]
MHAAWDDTVGAVLGHLAERGFGRDLRLVYAGRQLASKTVLAELCLPPDSTLHLLSRLRSTPYPDAWQLASYIVSIASIARSDPLNSAAVSGLDDLVKEFILCAHRANQRQRHDRDSPIDAQAMGDQAAHYLEIFHEAGVPFALVGLYAAYPHSTIHFYAGNAIKCFLTMDPSALPPDVLPVTAPLLLEFCGMLSLSVGKEDELYRSCRSMLASVLCLPSGLPASLKLKSPSKLIEQVLPFAEEIVDAVMYELASLEMTVSSKNLEDLSNFFKVLRQQALCWVPNGGPLPKNLYNSERDSWVWKLHDISMNLLNRVDECLKKLEMDLSLSSESRGVNVSQSRWVARSHMLVVLTQLDFISMIYEDLAHNLRLVLLAHIDPLNALVRFSKRNEHLHWLVKHKDLLCFEARRNLVMMMLAEGKDEYGELHEMLIDRAHLLDESFGYIMQAKSSELHSGLFMEFKNEEATGPGVLREWFFVVCQALFNPQQVLFSPCPSDRKRFFLNGRRIIGLALMHRVQVGITLDNTLVLPLAGRSIKLEDIRQADPVLYKSCKDILKMDAAVVDGLELTFSRDVHELGSRRTIELCSGGKDLRVNIRNREHYIDLLIKNTFVDSISVQLTHFARGFSDILVDPELRKVFFDFLGPEDLDRMLGGRSNTINLEDWKLHTQYNGYKEKDRNIIWFWKAVEGMSIEQQRDLLFFWTSVKFLPPDGFGGLASKLYIYKASESADRLPSSHTCFYRLCLPAYPSLKVTKNQLQKIAQEHVSCSFGTW